MPGKEVLIKSVVQAIPIYMMSMFAIPEGIIDEIHAMIAMFWWGSTENKRKIHWWRWEKMCKPKSKGGMGFRDLKVFNQALLAKQIWRIMSKPESLVSRVLKARYFKNSSVLEACRGFDPSFTWRSMWGAKSLLLEGLCWRVGNGSMINVWDDKWIPGANGCSAPVPNLEANGELCVAELLDESGSCWNVDKLHEIMLPDEYWEASGFDEILSNIDTTSFASWVIGALETLHGEEKGRFLAILWAMWSIRNDNLFEEVQRSPEVAIMGLTRMVSDYQGHRAEVGAVVSRGIVGDIGAGAWSVPEEGIVKINCDAAIFYGVEVGLGAVGRNSSGAIVFVASRRHRAGWSVEVAEAKALKFGLEMAMRLELNVVELESDALNVAKAVSRRAFSRSGIGICIHDICRFFSLLEVKNVSHVKRGGNTVAHLTARLCSLAGEERVFVTDFPDSVTSLAEIDLI
ncbi:uncharacterized protein LOC141651279 [Silene latifolia]|uniref:uncharacterized protein LOC141651279 n=1 Tax=Silene latifolia TaxID=37657 RepID=UPI003D780A3F